MSARKQKQKEITDDRPNDARDKTETETGHTKNAPTHGAARVHGSELGSEHSSMHHNNICTPIYHAEKIATSSWCGVPGATAALHSKTNTRLPCTTTRYQPFLPPTPAGFLLFSSRHTTSRLIYARRAKSLLQHKKKKNSR